MDEDVLPLREGKSWVKMFCRPSVGKKWMKKPFGSRGSVRREWLPSEGGEAFTLSSVKI